ncbi:Catenin-beta-like protein [Fimicolochytrium jonesii]|uniref:Catenin-beta-like protein n=1 Tax=Fimicolochytrium jonesii TaxID=1396493 RepID=UPI0022FED08C|nr:Catenin-beta-like protein [Fimicolochytrium jonesii]KAI8825867.1 Catenin-beta-like protein [Fimicolochytrium jonesii]
MNVDSIFKVPAPPTNFTKKRKLPSTPDVSSLKKFKPDNDEEDYRAGWGPGKLNTPSTGPENGAAPEDDEDVRFYGEGLDAEQKKIWDIVDAGEELPETIDVPQLKRMVLKLEKIVNKNQEFRMKYANDPIKFIESEADLDEELKNMQAASASPEIYSTLVDLGTHATVLSLLSHENTDISIAAVELLNELTDEDLVAEASEEAEEGMKVLVKGLIDNDALSLLVHNLQRLNEEQTEDKQGVFNTLSVIENFIAVDPALSEKVVAETTLLNYILQRIRTKVFDSNRQYATELLAILLQRSRANRLKLGELGGVDVLLQVLSAYKRKDPKDPDEIELLENVFDALCAVLAEPEGKEHFLEGEGMELMLLMVKEKKLARMRAFKVLSHAMLGADGAKCCAHFVEIFGLRTLFPALMRKGVKQYKKTYKAFSETEEDEYLVTIMASLLKNLTQLDLRERFILKFVGSDIEKVDRLMDMHLQYYARVAAADATIAERQRSREDEDLDEDELEAAKEEDFLDKLTAGFFTLQLLDFVIAFVCFEDASGEVRKKVTSRLEGAGQSIETIKSVLKEYANNVGESSSPKPAEPSSTESAADATESSDAYAQRERAMIIGVMEAL